MPLSREFKATVRERVQRDPKFGEELFREAMECLLAGELETAKAILRDYVNATVGFQKLSALSLCNETGLTQMYTLTRHAAVRISDMEFG